MKKEVIISDFYDAVKEKEFLAEQCTAESWEVVSYETAEISGKLLIASQDTFPKPVTIEPNLEGWYRIYVCMTSFEGQNHTFLKLTDDEFSTHLESGSVQEYVSWHASEQVEEVFWKAADMTGQDITISKVDYGQPHTANICWLRFVSMTDEEVETYNKNLSDTSSKTMIAHLDGDFDQFDMSKTPHDYCKAIYSMKDSDVKIICQEVINDFHILDSIDENTFVGRTAWARTRAKSWIQFHKWRDEIYKEQISYAHAHGMEMYATHRVSLSNFAFPLESPLLTEAFVSERPEFRCKARDGRHVDYLSFAYKEVRDYRIENLKTVCKHGFDGVNLLFIRGMNVAFEEPVIERFREKYGDSIDCRRLPATDKRIHGIWCDILTDFMRELRAQLDTKIFVTTMFSIEDNIVNGIDVERWAKEGLIDGVIQGKMSIWEEIDDVLDDDGLINIEQYSKKAETQYVLGRNWWNIGLVIQGLPEYRKISDKYGLALYSELPWETTVPPVELIEVVKDIYQSGGMHLALWDCYPARVIYRPEWQCTSQMGSFEKVNKLSVDKEDYRKVYKILSYAGKDIRYYHPGWRG